MRSLLPVSARTRALRVYIRAQRHEARGAHALACALYAQAAQRDPEWAEPLLALALNQRDRADYPAMLDACEAALARDPDHGFALWNVGLAATATGQWRRAREAWRRYGLEVAEGDTPIHGFFGIAALRLHGPDDYHEDVWVRRICPVRAVIENVPYPESGYRYGDIVLLDGVPAGEVMRERHPVPVFSVLSTVSPAAHGTFECAVDLLDPEAWSDLKDLAESRALAVESWPTPSDPPGSRLGISAPSLAAAKRLIADWSKRHGGVRAGTPRERLKPRAGRRRGS
jgi:tetratricopeptide (TPR) repeat protein